jgi:hypothetical protein
MKVQLATGIYSEKKDTKDVVISNIRREVSQKGVRMYVMDCDIVLAKSKDETVIDRRVLYKTGETQMSEVRDALISYVADKLAKAGTAVTYVTEQTLLDTIGNDRVTMKADVYRSERGNLIVSLLY